MKLQELRAAYPTKGTHKPLLVTEVTRMTGGIVCVAGIDINTGSVVRPLYPNGTNWPENEWCAKDIMTVGNVIYIEPHDRVPTAYPHATEDLSVIRAYRAGKVSGIDLHDICGETRDKDVSSLFSGAVIDRRYVNDGTMCRSLGCIGVPLERLHPHVSYGKVRVSFEDADGNYYDPPVTELKTKSVGDADAGHQALLARLGAHSAGSPVFLRLGLTRGWAGPDHDWNPRRCTIQINGIIERH